MSVLTRRLLPVSYESNEAISANHMARASYSSIDISKGLNIEDLCYTRNCHKGEIKQAKREETFFVQNILFKKLVCGIACVAWWFLFGHLLASQRIRIATFVIYLVLQSTPTHVNYKWPGILKLPIRLNNLNAPTYSRNFSPP